MGRLRVNVLLVLAGTLALFLTSGALAGSERSARRAATGEFVEGEKLTGSRSTGHAFGRSVDISADGRVLLVGGDRRDDRDLKNAGAAWVFVRSGSGWRQAVRLEAPTKDYAAGIWDFGEAVALSAQGNVAVVGALGRTNPIVNGKGPRPAEGSAWVYTGERAGATRVVTKLPIRGAGAFGRVGDSVAVADDGATVAVAGPGARRTLGEPKGEGAVWIFTHAGSKWKQTAKLVVKGSAHKPTFGSSLALSGDGRTLLVGGDDGVRDRRRLGAVWIFARSGSTWRLQGKLADPRLAEATEDFGWGSIAVAADGRTALVGASSGGGILLQREGSAWVVRGRLQPAEALGEDLQRSFGQGVALSGDGKTALVRALGSFDRRTVWVFKRASARAFRSTETLIKDESSTLGLSFALANRGDVAVVGRESYVGQPPTVTLYARGLPLISRIDPNVGPEAGGTEVTLIGRNFTNVSAVRFGAVSAASFAVDSPTRIRAAAPPGRRGSVSVTVASSVGVSSEKTRFRYVPPPVVEAVEPSFGPTGGGTSVRIHGRDLYDVNAVKFGATPAASFRVVGNTEITAVSPPGQAGRVTVTASTPFDTSRSSAEFTYVSPEAVIGFDDLSTGGPGQALVTVSSQYASQGVTFNSLSAIDYAKGTSPLPGFARSGTVGVEPCVGVELCTIPVRATFSAAKRLVRVWVGFSGAHAQPLQVRLTALTAANAIVGTATATLPASTTATPIRTPLEVSSGTAAITQLEVTIPGGTNNALAIDDVTFDSG
jgi:IPT/TIG domain